MSKKMIGYIVSALVIGTLLFLMVQNTMDQPEALGVSENSGSESELADDLEQFEYAPDFSLMTLDGETITLAELKGKKVILNFWATWCPPCKAEMPHMESYYSKLTEDDAVEMIAVNVTQSEKLGVSEVEKFVESYNLSFPIPLDETGLVTQLYGVFSMPTTYMIDANGRIAQKIIGPLDEKGLNELVDFMD